MSTQRSYRHCVEANEKRDLAESTRDDRVAASETERSAGSSRPFASNMPMLAVRGDYALPGHERFGVRNRSTHPQQIHGTAPLLWWHGAGCAIHQEQSSAAEEAAFRSALAHLGGNDVAAAPQFGLGNPAYNRERF